VHWNWNWDNPYDCKYIGKSSNIFNRVKLHLGHTHRYLWYKKYKLSGNKLKKSDGYKDGYLLKWDTASQFRSDMEHQLFKNNEGISFIDILT